jgi:hypothetical protein
LFETINFTSFKGMSHHTIKIQNVLLVHEPLTLRNVGAIVTLVDSSTCSVRLLATMRGSQYQTGNTRKLNIPSVDVPPASTRNLQARECLFYRTTRSSYELYNVCFVFRRYPVQISVGNSLSMNVAVERLTFLLPVREGPVTYLGPEHR